MKKRFILLLATAVSSVGTGVALAQNPSPAPEAQLIEVLKSNTEFKTKTEACRGLALHGTKEAVPALAALLGDEKLSHFARYALEQIHDPAGTAALRDALGTAKGLPLIGVISSVGNVRDTQAVPALAKFLADGDADTADAAAQALGRIGGPAAAKALMTVVAKPTTAVYDGLLRCAESLPGKEAAPLYDAVRVPAAPAHLRMAGLRGAILSRGDQGLPILFEALHGNDNGLIVEAIQTARDLPGMAVTKALAADLDKLDADRKLLLVQALGDRKDAAAGPQLLAAARKSDGALRIASVKALVQVGDAAALPYFAELVASDDAETAKAARTALGGFSGKAAETSIVTMMKSPNAKVRLAAADLIAQRKITSAIPQLVQGAGDADPGVAAANLRAAGDICAIADAPTLIKVLTSGTATPAAESALSSIYVRIRDESAADALGAALPNATTPVKISLVRLLRRVGGPKALAYVRTAMADANGDVKDTAVRSLYDWPTPDALPDLMALAKTPSTPAAKVLALRGALRLIPLQNSTPAEKLESVKAALPLVERPEEKRLALTALSGIPTVEALALVVPELATDGLKEEASQAAVTIAEQLAKTQPAAVSEAMTQVVKTTKDAKLVKRAQALLGPKTP